MDAKANTTYLPPWAASAEAHPHNRLLLWTSPILTLAIRLSNYTQEPEGFKDLHGNVCNTLKIIENNMHSAGYRPQYAFACRYLLCAIVDNSISLSSWGKKTNWDDNNLVDSFQGEQWSSKEFFQILQRSANQPEENIDFLELTYYGLRLGLHKKTTKEQQKNIDLIIKNVGNCLKHQRRHPKQHLLISNDYKISAYKHPWKHIKIRIIITFILVALLLTTGIGTFRSHNYVTMLEKHLQQTNTPTTQNKAKHG